MRNMYEVGKVYVWHNLVKRPCMNGKETTVIGDVILTQYGLVQMTDTPLDLVGGWNSYALPGKLRPKHPPSGEKGISDMFSNPVIVGKVVEEALEGC